MADKKKKPAAKTSRKDARHKVEQQLSKALAHLVPALGEKKFKRRMKEAGKLIMHGVDISKKEAKATPAKKAAAKGPSKKVAKAPAKKKLKK